MPKFKRNRWRTALAPLCEQFESRQLLTVFGGPWPEPNALSLSFVPDGTRAAEQSTDLFESLNRQFPTAVWQQEILKAFQTWAVQSNINIGLAADDGSSFGSLGMKQGDPRFGDIRIGSTPLSSDVLAVADPYDPFVANTWVGDVFLNSSVPFSIGGQGVGYDLFSVMLHEAGHVFGMAHNPNPDSPMYSAFHLTSPDSLDPQDISDLQRLFGARDADQYDSVKENDSILSATSLVLASSGEGAAVSMTTGDLTTQNDVDFYQVSRQSGSGPIQIHLNARGISLLQARVTILSSDGRILDVAEATDSLQNDIALTVDGLDAGERFIVKIESARSDVFGIGSYDLHIGEGTAPVFGEEVDSPTAGVQVLETTPGYVEHTYYEVDGTLTPDMPMQTYQVRSADLGSGMTNVMTVLVNPLYPVGPNYRIQITDDQGQLVPSELLYQADRTIEVQVPAVQSNRDYFVHVFSDDLSAGDADFEITVDYDQEGSHLQTIASEWIQAGESENLRSLQVTATQQFHFSLAGSDFNAPAETGVRMTIHDQNGRQVFLLEAEDGGVRAGDVVLMPGLYTVRITRKVPDIRQSLYFQLRSATESSPLGPELRDTTLVPEVSDPAALSQLSFYWLAYSPPVSSPVLSGNRRSLAGLGLPSSQTGAVSSPLPSPFPGMFAGTSVRELPAASTPAEPVIGQSVTSALTSQTPGSPVLHSAESASAVDQTRVGISVVELIGGFPGLHFKNSLNLQLDDGYISESIAERGEFTVDPANSPIEVVSENQATPESSVASSTAVKLASRSLIGAGILSFLMLISPGRNPGEQRFLPTTMRRRIRVMLSGLGRRFRFPR